MIARVYRSDRRVFTCRLLEGKKALVEATAKGTILKYDEIVVGDLVQVELDERGNPVITEVAERKNEIFRQIVRENKKKVTAANCDLLVIMACIGKPEYKRGIVDRFLVRSGQWNIPAIVVFNKMDLMPVPYFNPAFEAERLQGLEIICFETSAKFPDYEKRYLLQGLTELRDYLQGKTAIFLGQSGVGKSQMIATLSGGLVKMKVGEIGKEGKGKHTTSWSEIVEVGEMLLIDSPGIRSLSVEDMPQENLIHYFPDVEKVAVHCQFANCRHDEYSEGCAFMNLPDGLRGDYLWSRLESYQRLFEEMESTPSWQKLKKK